jgi:D-methionine transport system substrate-binding protein
MTDGTIRAWCVGLLVLVCACTRSDGKLKVGVIAGPEEEVAKVAVKLAKDRFDLGVELVTFNDYVIPNAALADGSLDANAFQHRPFLEQQMRDRGYALAVVGNSFVYPLAAYSQRIKQLTELRAGARIAVPNDPTNLGRALLLLAKHGLFTLRPDAGVLASPRDIADNPRQLEIVELEAPQLPRALADVDLAVINTTYASQVGLSALKDGLVREDRTSPYVNVIVARADNQRDPRVLQFVAAYQTEEVLATAEKLFQGGVVKGW